MLAHAHGGSGHPVLILKQHIKCDIILITMESSGPLLAGKKRRRLFCEHCKSFKSKTAYYRHRAKYFDPRRKVWTSEREVVQPSSSDSDSSIQWEGDQDSISPETDQGTEQRKYHVAICRVVCDSTPKVKYLQYFLAASVGTTDKAWSYINCRGNLYEVHKIALFLFYRSHQNSIR